MTGPCPAPDVQTRVQQSFRRGLASYHSNAVAQAQIAARLAAMLAAQMQAAGAPAQLGRALEFGCGTGHLTAPLLQRFAIGRLVLNDLVAECEAVVRPLLPQPFEFRAGAIETLALPDRLDLIASASTVQWVADPAALLARLAAHLAPGGWLALSGYGRGHFAELQGLDGFGKAPSCHDPQDWPALLPAGMQIRHLTAQTISLPFSSSLSLLRHLRLTGVNAGARGHWTRGDLAAFDLHMRAAQPQPGPLRLSYQPVYLIARKAF